MSIQNTELLFVVDENNQPQKPLPRNKVHGYGIWHRVVHIWVINSSGQILCERRSMLKDSNPGWWESFFGGHLAPGENDLDAAARELKEELGITAQTKDFKLWKVYKHFSKKQNNEFQAIVTINWNGGINDVSFEDEEVDQVVWKDAKDIKKLLIKEGGKTWVNCGYELDMIEHLETQT